LAQIAVSAGVTSITAANITDERGDATVCGVAGVKHSWSYLNNVTLDVTSMTIDAGVSDRDPVYFNGTKWVVATVGAVGFYDEANASVITAGYLDGFTGLTPGAIVDNRGIAITATEIVVLETPIDTNGVKQVGDISGTLTGNLNGYVFSDFAFTDTATGNIPIIMPSTSAPRTWTSGITPSYNTVIKLVTPTNTGTITISATGGVFSGETWIPSTCAVVCKDAGGSTVASDSLSLPYGGGGTITKVVSIPITTRYIAVTGSREYGCTGVYAILSGT